ncbi:hypothetical protein PV08_06864 [Exophiala spinifera]|uniref:Protein KTI12 n=1 Tax=Exophiala spinifera TaxID=91928 RepID=A0A0D2B5B6_9EURO|nr:uncharacterized protein PV08_06864 [Exophiala spinifera]KIW14083.1 hypothetical protein PV08_06864 [Exophiala spinifera]
MPLIIITGLPCSGKTHRARQIAADLENYIASDPASAKRTVQIVSSHHASADTPLDNQEDNKSTEPLRDQIYNSAAQEKTARAAEFSAIKRAVSRDNIVIADGLNYIKGYRYQLWCEAKAAGTRCCVVHVAAQEDDCKKWNRKRLRVWGRDDEGKDEPGHDEKNNTPQGPSRSGRQGETVMGDLVPESHTAIYGDRVVEKASRSRSSSMDGGGLDDDDDDDDDDDEGARRPRRRPQVDDTMTLKSLYISKTSDHNRGSQIQTTTNGATTTTTTNSLEPNNSSPRPPPPSTTIVPPPPTSSQPYSSSTLTSLTMRYEPPSPFSRWDTPLFTVPSADTAPPSHDIWTAIFPPPAKPTSKKALSQLSQHTAPEAVPKQEEVRRHAATVLPRATGSDALQVLENATMDVVRHLLVRAREDGVADADCCGTVNLVIPATTATASASSGAGAADRLVGSSVTSGSGSESVSEGSSGDKEKAGEGTSYETTIYVPSSVALSQPVLQRLRRKYTQMQRGGIAHGQGYVKGRMGVVKGFIEFLEHEWNDDG